MGVKRWRKKVEDRSVWAVILKETLPGPYANSQKDEGETEEGSLSDLHVVWLWYVTSSARVPVNKRLTWRILHASTTLSNTKQDTLATLSN
jgi:hypothetical protein